MTLDRLEGHVRNYDWGSPTALAEIRGIDPTGDVEAELWFGAHPTGSARLIGADRPLVDVVADDPTGELGAIVAARFGELPFLFKVLAVDRPLSLQTHPSAIAAVIADSGVLKDRD